MEEGCTIDAKFRNVDIENVLTAGSFTISDDIAFENVNVQNDLTVANDATILSSLTVSKNSTTLLSVTQSNTNITNSLNVTGPLTSSNLQVKDNLIKTHTINNQDRVSFNLTGDPDELVDINGNVKIRGTLTVEGAQTSNQQISSTSNSPLLELASGFTGTPSNDGGLIIIRGNEENAFIGIDESLQKFTMGTGQFTSSNTGNLSIAPGILVMNTFEGNLKGNVTGNVIGNVTGNSDTVTNGIYTTSSVTELSDISSSGSGSIISDTERTKLNNIEENADVTDSDNVYSAGAVMTTGNYSQTITGTKTFSDTITGSITGNAGSVTNGVYTSGDQTINGIKTFTQTIQGNISGNSATSSGIVGTLSITQGGTGATSLNNLIILGTHTNGNYVSTITAGNDLSTTGTNIENSNHTISLNSNISSVETIYNSNLIIGNNSNNNINFSTNEINFKISNINQLKIIDGSIIPIVTNDIDIGSSTLKYKNAYFDGIIYGDVTGNVTGNVTGDITGNVTGNLTGNADTVTNGIYTTSSVTELSDISSSGSGSIITNTERTKLNGIEENADVTDSTNVYNAGAVMTTGNYSQTITGTKTFSNTIIGDLTGNVTGDLTGNITGNVTGDLTGNVTGDLTGNVTINNGNTLDVSNGTLTLANDQISGDKIEGGTINNITVNNLTTSLLSVDNLNFDVNTISSTNSNGNITLDPNGTGNTIIDSNVGIGTTNPSAKLHIHSNGEALRLQGSSTGSDNDEHTYMSFYPVDNTNRYGYIGYTTSGTEDLNIWNQRNGNLKFSTNNTERMRISNSGFIGIGTDDPNVPLKIVNSIDGDTIQIVNSNTSGTGKSSIFFGPEGNFWELGARNSNSGDLTNKFYLYDRTNSEVRLVVDPSGNVGIGTTSPSAKLHIRSNTTGQNSLLILENNTTTWGGNNDGASIEFRTDENGNKISQAKILIADPTPNSSEDADLVFQTRGTGSVTEKMRISYLGNVGIGTTNPTEKLTVHGTDTNLIPCLGLKNGMAGGDNSTYGAQIAFGWNGTNNYQHFISTRHYGGQVPGNRMDFYTCDGTQANTITNGSNLVMSLNGRNVGIGTDNPTSALHVVGPINEREAPVGVHIGTHANTYSAIELISYSNHSGWIDFYNTSTGDSNTDFSERIRGGVGQLEFYTNEATTQRMTIDSSGNVGIGTTDPSYNLDLYHGNLRLLHRHDSSVYNNFLTFERASDDCRINHYCNNEVSAQIDFNGWSTSAQSTIQFSTKESSGSLTNRMTINYNGFVGINTSNPSMRLDVRGGIYVNGNGQNSYQGFTVNNSNSGVKIGNWLNDIHSSWLYWYYGSNVSVRFSNDTNLHTLSFTGQHICILNKNVDENSIGLIVSSSGKYINLDNSIETTINECLPICNITKIDNDIKVFGVISDKEDTDDNRYHGIKIESVINKTNKNEQRIYINSLGEGAVWVCNKNGNLVNGDYISSSSVAGYGMRQNTNKLLNSTVAKITCDCDFSLTKIVKQKLNVITTTEPYEENVFEEIEKTNTENVIEYDEELSRYVQKEVTTTKTEKEQVYDTVDLYNEDGEVIGTHQVERKITKTKTVTEINYDENGNVQYEDDLDENGNQQMIYPFDTRFLLPDGTQINEIEYNNKKSLGEIVYLACFVGCTYHCG